MPPVNPMFVFYAFMSLYYFLYIYLATLTGIDNQYYQAIAIDGGGKWKQIQHVSIPALVPVIVIL